MAEFSLGTPMGRLKPEDMGTPDYMTALAKGLELGNKPATMSQTLLASMLGNKINQAKAKYAEQQSLADLAYKRAGTGHLNAQSGLIPFQKALLQAQREKALRAPVEKMPTNKFGQLIWLKNHPEYTPQVENKNSYVPSIGNNTENTYQQNIPMDLNELIKKELSSSGKNGVYQGAAREANDLSKLIEEKGIDSIEAKTAQKILNNKMVNQETLGEQRTNSNLGLKKGESWALDDEGNRIGINRRASPAQIKEEGGRAFFTPAYEFALNSSAYYSGQGSIGRWNNDVSNFKDDPKAHERVIRRLASIKLVSALKSKENQTIGGSNTKWNLLGLEKGLTSSDVPSKLEDIFRQYRLPRTAELEAGKLFLKELNRATKAAEHLPATYIEYNGNKKKGFLYNKKTKKVEEHLVDPSNWESFTKAGGY